ncbi:MAG: hypothetical protein J6O40_01885 [Ruminococcus sp.]|nr:hypothetical protein [Ruminococcus sp.]
MPKKERTENMTDRDWRKQRILNTFGPEGTIEAGEPGNDNSLYFFDPKVADEYNSIKLPVPEGMTPEMVALVAMGAGMDKDKYDFKKSRTASSPGGDIETFNQGFLYMNICADEARVRGFSDIMVDSRKQAKTALDAYANGDHTLVDKYIKNVAEQAKKANLAEIELNGSSVCESPAHEMRLIVNDLIKDNKFGVGDMFTENDKIRYNASSEYIHSVDKSNEIKNRLLKDPPEAGSDERKKLVEEMMFNKMLASSGTYGLDIGTQVTDTIKNISNEYKDSISAPLGKYEDDVSEYFTHYGSRLKKEDNRTPTEEGMVYLNAASGQFQQTLDVVQKTYISPISLMLNEPDGKQKVKDLFIGHIRELPEYKAMIDAKTPDEMKKAIDNAESLKLENLSDKVDIDSKLPKTVMENDPLYIENKKNAGINVSKAVCLRNSKFFTEKLIKINNAQAELKEGEFEDEYAAELRPKFETLIKLNDEYDHNKGPIANDPEYKKLADETMALSNAYDKKLATIDPIKDSIKLLNSQPKSIFQSGHQDSTEIIALREKTMKLKELADNFDYKNGGNINDDPAYQEAALEVFKASVAYRKKVAKDNINKKGWEPSSDMGKDRYKGAFDMQNLAKSIAPELIEKYMIAEFQRDSIERNADNKKDFDNLYKNTLDSLKQTAPMPIGDHTYAENAMAAMFAQNKAASSIARLIAIKTINNKYEQMIKNGEIKKIENTSKFNQNIVDCTKNILNREDFKRMMKDNSVEDLINAASVKNGKGLMTKLGEAHIKVGNEKALAQIKAKKQPAAEAVVAPKNMVK